MVEILVVVMVIMVIAAIAIPNLLQARMQANEAAAVASIHVIHTGEVLYAEAYPQVGFAGNLADLGRRGGNCHKPSPTGSCIILDDALTNGLKSGYTFALSGDGNTPDASYTITATPQSLGASGRCIYTSDQAGQVRATPRLPAGAPNPSPFSTGGGGACGQS